MVVAGVPVDLSLLPCTTYHHDSVPNVTMVLTKQLSAPQSSIRWTQGRYYAFNPSVPLVRCDDILKLIPNSRLVPALPLELALSQLPYSPALSSFGKQFQANSDLRMEISLA